MRWAVQIVLGSSFVHPRHVVATRGFQTTHVHTQRLRHNASALAGSAGEPSVPK